jgi:hypothetical protein
MSIVWDDWPVSPLVEVADSLRVVGEALDAYFNSRLGDAEPSEGSKAAREWRSRVGAVDGAGTMFTAGWVWTTLGIPSDHLQAVSRLIYSDRKRASVHRFGVLSLLRVALEVSALCWRLIDPAVTARERMQRTLLHERWSLDQRGRGDGNLSTIEPAEGRADSMAALQARIDELAEEHHLQGIMSGKRNIPKASDLIGTQFKAIGGFSGDARSIYARLSEVTHGNMLGTLEGYTRPPEREQLTGPGVPLWLTCVGAQYAALGFWHAVYTFLDFMGWNTEDWSELTVPALRTLEAIAESMNASASARTDGLS